MRVVRYVGETQCNAEEYREIISSAGNAAIIDTLSAMPNVTLSFTCDGKPLQVDFNDMVNDFLALSVVTYIADELNSRASTDDRWTRDFSAVIPMHDPTAWENHAQALGSVLRVLTGDNYSFSWPARSALPPSARHRTQMPTGFDTVCLFSGGLDSLCGAYQLLSERRRVLLVGHQAEGVTSSAQMELANALRSLFPDSVSFIQCRVARSPRLSPTFPLPPKSENSHRIRSFLFLGLGVAIAAAAGISEVVIPENGLIALNPPLQVSRVGSLSTRTAHPAFLFGYSALLSDLGIYRGRLWNPFIFDSKTDMMEDAEDALRRLALRSVSCSHANDVRWILPADAPHLDSSSGDRARHCGYCIPCIYRRVALLSIGADDRKHYVVDVFRDLPRLSVTKQSDFRALAAFASSVVAADETKRQMMVLSHGHFAPEVGGQIGTRSVTDYSIWSDMLLRWSQSFLNRLPSVCSEETLSVISL